MPDIGAWLGQNLARCRKAAGMSQEDLAIGASLHRTEIGLLERGERIPKIDTVAKLAGTLNVAPGQLMKGIKWSPGGQWKGNFGARKGRRSGRGRRSG
jgi:transcriptional regulator with XRE-family HTH domain